MTFAEKLDFLMSIAKISNSMLAHNVNLDASYISRLRNGKRHMPKDNNIIQDMAAFLTRQFKKDYQKKALLDALHLKGLPQDNGLLANEIFLWLTHNEKDNAKRVEDFLGGFSILENHSVPQKIQEEYKPPFPKDAVSIYYGIEGKRRAVEYFLSEVAEKKNPRTLLLFSDEETSWMADNPEYTRKWTELMARVLARGNRIKIIHTISRDLGEMLDAINQWMPLYMSGLIKPYFYPKKRDGIFKRTLFVAPETTAIVSNSIGRQVYSAASILFRDRDVVASFTEEFLNYLHICRPLMQLFLAQERENCLSALIKFDQQQANTLIKTESLSMLTMPEHLFMQIIRRAELEERDIISAHRIRHQCFLNNLKSKRFAEIISLPDIKTAKSKSIKVSASGIMNNRVVYYSLEEFTAHLNHILSLLKSHENYHVYITNKPENRYMVYVKEDMGVIVGKTSQSPLLLTTDERNLTAAFWDFLKSTVDKTPPYTASDKTKSISKLQTYLAKLKTN